jgi:hypothetical protein
MACAPADQATLDYEQEEEALFRAVSGQDVAFDSCDLGTFEELRERVSEYRPHILHLTGHGVVRDGKGHFVFEKEDGTADMVPAEELRRFLAGSCVQCVFASGCRMGLAPREALAGACPSPVSLGPLSAGQRGAALGGWGAHQEEEPEDLIRPAPAFAHSSGTP